MKLNQAAPLWPYFGVLSVLLTVVLAAPRSWEPLARRPSVESFLRQHRARASSREPALVVEPLVVRFVDQLTGALAAEQPVERPAPSEPLAHDIPAPAEAGRAAAEPVVALPRPALGGRVERLPIDAPNFARESSNPLRIAPSPSPTADWNSLDSQSAQSAPAAAERLPAPTPAAAADVPTLPQSIAEAAATVAPPGEPLEQVPAIRIPRPEDLLAELQILSVEPRTADWAAVAARLLDEVCGQPAGLSRDTKFVLDDLRRHSLKGESLAATIADVRLESQVLRAQYALARRVDVWDRALRLVALNPVADEPTDEQMPQVLESVETLTRGQQQGAAWRDYLQLPRLRGALQRDGIRTADERREVARNVLARLTNVRLSRDQRRFLEHDALADFRVQLRRWAAEPVERDQLLVDLEKYERSGAAVDARRLADDCRWLCWSGQPAAHDLGQRVEEHYRNANLRIAVASTFVSRFLPQPEAIVAPVYDRIAGADVEGLSTTYTNLSLQLIPDRKRLRLGLEAHGVVASNTAATSGPATLYNEGESRFTVRKFFLFGPRGLTVFPAVADAQSTRSNLVDVETDYDGIPLVGSMVRSIARSEHAASQSEARAEVEQKIAARARLQFDNELQPKLAQATERFTRRVRKPLDHLGLDPQALAVSTTEDRAVLRLRLAGQNQLGAHTPRPRAPSDSLVSLQLHESALKNVLEQLQLDGRTFKLPELFEHLAQKLGRAKVSLPEDLPAQVTVKFAAHDAVRLHCDEGQIEVRISLAELSERRRRWRNFTVRTYYRPDPTSLETRFVRASGIFLEGESLKGKPQIALRAVFSKVLSPTRPWGLIEPKLAADPRAKDLEITQFTVDKGWIGIAYAARRQAPALAARPQPVSYDSAADPRQDSRAK